MKGIGDRIKARRIQLEMTQDDLARKTGVKASTVLRWETGETKTIKTDRMEVLADALQVSVSYLMGLTGDMNGKGNKHDLEVEALLEKIHKDENIRILLDSAADLTKEDIQFVVNLVHNMRGMTKK